MTDVHPQRHPEWSTAAPLEIVPRNFGNAKTAVDAANVIGVEVSARS